LLNGNDIKFDFLEMIDHFLILLEI